MPLITTRRSTWLQTGALAVLLAGSAALAGCEPRLDPEEYGEVIDGMPHVEGADRPYPLPELDKPATSVPQEAPQDSPK